jgi:hypothetical protein
MPSPQGIRSFTKLVKTAFQRSCAMGGNDYPTLESAETRPRCPITGPWKGSLPLHNFLTTREPETPGPEEFPRLPFALFRMGEPPIREKLKEED